MYVGNYACTLQEIFGVLTPDHDGCEGTRGPLWLHFVVTGNVRVMELMIKNGADLSRGFLVHDMPAGIWRSASRGRRQPQARPL